jgi:hypothetical protein
VDGCDTKGGDSCPLIPIYRPFMSSALAGKDITMKLFGNQRSNFQFHFTSLKNIKSKTF